MTYQWRRAGGVAVAIAVLCVAAARQLMAASGQPRAGAVIATHRKPAMPYVAVKGNHLVNAAGRSIRLLGVDRSGAEYMCVGGSAVFDGPVNAAAVKAMVSWKIDAVRVPLNEDCWLGINGIKPSVSGERYQLAIKRYVSTLQSYGLIVILDLHWAAPGNHVANSQWPMADADHAPAFWKSVAETFKANHGLIFDLFNEPYISSWPCWRNGCSVTYSANGPPVTYKTAGMQSLVDAVRSTGATQPLMLGGLAWSSDESRWLKYVPTDPDHQLVVSFHTYNFSGCNNAACWASTIAPLAKKVPVVTGELGENGCTDSYIDRYMPWADRHGISYFGWTWDSTGPPSNWSCSNGPALITSYAGRPTSYGIGLKNHLAALARHTGSA
ncbi:MAG: cellulase family glycosylhydrolase [Acidimicrobiales bacterium]|jgi:hypothetical protein